MATIDSGCSNQTSTLYSPSGWSRGAATLPKDPPLYMSMGQLISYVESLLSCCALPLCAGTLFVSSKWSHTRPIFWLIHIYSHVSFLWESCSFIFASRHSRRHKTITELFRVIVWGCTVAVGMEEFNESVSSESRWLDNTCRGFPGTTWKVCKPDSCIFVRRLVPNGWWWCRQDKVNENLQENAKFLTYLASHTI